jgi:hypothetical protein
MAERKNRIGRFGDNWLIDGSCIGGNGYFRGVVFKGTAEEGSNGTKGV